jgi:hypothetical protein
MLLYPAPEKFNTFNTFNTFATFHNHGSTGGIPHPSSGDGITPDPHDHSPNRY